MLNEFKEHLGNKFLNLLTERFVLACSGGLDSVVLAHLCHSLKLDFILAHCNFQLRGNESDADEEFVKGLATDMNIDSFITHFDTIGYLNKNKISVQMAARELRYHWFAQVLKENHITTLVTAHHADDNLETFLINLSRGTGIDGLTGIPEKTETISRPLLYFSRKTILEYAQKERLKWREDSSNSDTKYLRNKIRHEIVPLIKELHPTLLKNFYLTQKHLKATSKIAENHMAQVSAALFEHKDEVIRINIETLKQLYPLDAYLYGLFKDYGFTEWIDVQQLLTAVSGKQVVSKTYRLVKDRHFLLLSAIKTENETIVEITPLHTEIVEPIHLKIESAKHITVTSRAILYVDKETLKYPLQLRKWKKGDYFYPLGMKGKKKLSKYFKDEKVDIISKEEQWLLCSEDKIVWVIGRRADDRFKVTTGTKHILKFELNP